MKVRAMACLGAAALGLPFTVLAAERGSINEFPIGITMGVPTASLPAPGVYLIEKPTASAGDSRDNDGRKTGGRVWARASNLQVQWVHDSTLFGAGWASYIRNIGVVDVHIRLPNGHVIHGSGLPDTQIVPLLLSWKLSHGFYLGTGLSFYVPDGHYRGEVAIGQNHWTLEPDFSLGYMGPHWWFNAHSVVNINSVNTDTHYRSGTTLDVDYSAIRRIGNFGIGVVGYYYKQISADHGPAIDNGGSPETLSTGLGATYHQGRIGLNLNLTQELYSHNLTRKSMGMLFISYRL